MTEPIILERKINYKSSYICGVDPNRRGKDETAIVVLECPPFANPETAELYVAFIETSNIQDLMQLVGKILYLHSLFNFQRIIIDETGLGSGLKDTLNERLGREKVEGFLFTRKSKPELFGNLQLLMQQGRLKFPNYETNNDERCKKLFFQFLSIQREWGESSALPQISHMDNTHDDVVAALALACWFFKTGKHVKRDYVLGMYSHTNK
jgi:phage FluMu gp28-like protein